MYTANKYDQAFVITGFANWKKALSKFSAHQSSSAHKQATQGYKTRCSTLISEKIDKQIKESQLSARKALTAIISCIKFLGRQGIALRGHKEEDGNFMQLLKLHAAADPDLASWLSKNDKTGKPPRSLFLSHDIQNEILIDVSHAILRSVVADVKLAEYFSLICDGTQDCSGQEQESICIRYVDAELVPHEVFVGMYQTYESTGKCIANLLKDVCLRLDLPLSCLRGQTYDGASNMSGAYRGAKSYILDYQPLAYYTHCAAHCVNLAAIEVSQIPILRDMLSCVNELGVVASRTSKLRNVVSAECVCSALRPLCPTRWTVRHAALRKCISNYSEIIASLSRFLQDATVTNEQKAKCSGIINRLSHGETFLAMNIANDIFKTLEKLATAVQGRQADFNGILDAVAVTQATLNMQRENFDSTFQRLKDIIQGMPGVQDLKMPRKRKLPWRFDSNPDDQIESTESGYFRRVFVEAYDVAKNHLTRRFDDSNQGLQAHNNLMHCLLSGQVNQEVLKYPEIASSDLASELAVYSRRLQGKNFGDYVEAMRSSSTEVRNLFPNVFNLLRLLLVRSVSSSECERSFSSLRRLKTWLRSTMTQTRLNAVAILHVHQQMTDNIDVSEIAEAFTKKNASRANIFGIGGRFTF